MAGAREDVTSASDHQQQPIGLIGGIGLTEVHVYAQRPAPDGTFSGCPHVHAVVDEGYFVLQGTGWVDFHDLEHGYRQMRLEPGDYVHFPPMVMHRLVSDGDLIILGMMGSAGLAERGEARIYFGRSVDEDAHQFQALMALPQSRGLEGALERRDKAVAGYLELMRLWETDRTAYGKELERFFTVHRNAMVTRVEEFTQQVHQGPMKWAEQTLQRLAALPKGQTIGKEAVRRNRRGMESALGMCGVLRPMLTLEKWREDGSGAQWPPHQANT